MAKLIHLSIRSKLALAFGLLLLSTVLLSVFTMQRVAKVNDAFGEVRNDYLPSVAIVGKLASFVQKLRIGEALHILLDDAAEIRSQEQAMAEVATGYRKAREDYGPLIDPGEETERFKAVDALWRQYWLLHERLIALSVGHEHAAMAGLFRADMNESFSALSRLLDVDIEYNRRTGVAAADAGEALWQSTRT